jgi:hypothetical protein
MTVAEWEDVTAVCASPEARAAGAVDAPAAAPVSAAAHQPPFSPKTFRRRAPSRPEHGFRTPPGSRKDRPFRFFSAGPDLIAARDLREVRMDGEPRTDVSAPLSGCIEDLAAVVGNGFGFRGRLRGIGAGPLWIGRDDRDDPRPQRAWDVVTGSLTIAPMPPRSRR